MNAKHEYLVNLVSSLCLADTLDGEFINNESNILLKVVEKIRSCETINWGAYLEHNDDVRKSGINPCEHFILFGINEQRELYFYPGSHSRVKSEKFKKLLKNSLPPDLALHDIVDLEEDLPRILDKIKRCARINWDAYLEQNIDVKSANIEPYEHFINHGIYEGRKLYSNHTLCKGSKGIRPIVSIIIPNYNNAIYLTKCLNSVVNQSLKEIEIIVIDDASTDNSLEIITDFVNQDSRIRLIRFDINQSAHMSRKAGILNSTGKYIMFLDPDDFYDIHACEIAVNYISKGYDIVQFGTYVVNQENHDKQLIIGCDKYLNNQIQKEFDRHGMFTNIFLERKATFTLWNKIYLSEICKKGAKDLEDGFLPVGQDLYAFLAIASHARNMYVIEQKLYYYNCGSGVSFITGSSNLKKRQLIRWKLVPYLKRICEKNQLKNYEHSILSRYFDGGFSHFFNLANKRDSWLFIDYILNSYEGVAGLINIISIFYDNPQKIADNIQYCNLEKINMIRRSSKQYHKFEIAKRLQKKRIGIFYFRIGIGGIERVISILSNILLTAGFEVSIFVEERCQLEIDIPEGITIYQVHPAQNDKDNSIKHLWSLEKVIRQSKIEILFHMWPSHPQFFWDSILYHYYNIAVIAQIHSDINWSLIYKKKSQFGQNAIISYLRCADKTICLNSEGELFLRSQGVDAEFIANPVHSTIYRYNNNNLMPIIATIARLSDPGKQIEHALLVIAEIAKTIPDVKLLLIGGTDGQAQHNLLLSKIDTLGIHNNVEITGWTNKTDMFLGHCDIFISTSYTEGFPLGIAEAQRMGIPVIMYDLPIAQKYDNESIITVSQGEYKTLANKIIDLLKNKQKLQKLSRIACKISLNYTEEKYAENILYFLRYYNILSSYRNINQNKYRETIKFMTFYASQLPPYLKK